VAVGRCAGTAVGVLLRVQMRTLGCSRLAGGEVVMETAVLVSWWELQVATEQQATRVWRLDCTGG